MIISCDKCNAKLQLDDHLIKKNFFKVKCSKCQHIFPVDLSSKEEVYELKASIEIAEKKVIALCNQKGGVAKTSSCLNLGVGLSFLGKKVLLIDFDAQANLSLLVGKKNEDSFYEIAQGKTTTLKTIKNIYPNLWLLPANNRINLLAKQALQQPKEFGLFLRNLLKPIKEHFDCILIDTPPSIKFFTPHALLASDLVIIPTQCEFLAMNGVMQMETVIQAISPNYPLDYRILMTLYDEKNTASKVIYNKLKERYNDKLLSTFISLDHKMQESQIVNEPLLYYAKNSPAALQYAQLAKQVELLLAQ
ncbi:MAG: AAA family ATPase [Methylococcaceae bacterium]